MEVRVTNANGGTSVLGRVKRTTLVIQRSEAKDLWRGGAATVAEAMKTGKGAWAIDALACEGLQAKGVEFVEIRTPVRVYRARLCDVMEHPAAYVHTTMGRAQCVLPLDHWTTGRQ